MTRPTSANRVEEVFSAAVAKGSAAERAAFLDGACGGDAALRERVEALLASHDAADSFLLRPPNPDAVPTVDHAPAAAREGPGAVIGRYKLLQLIGEGGFGSVFMAEQSHPVRRKVALKIIKLGMDTKQVIARFEAERQALALMDHPNIAKVLDAGSTDTGRPYFVMELVKGVPITEYCDTNNLSTRERLELFMPVCHAVQHAHQKGIIHRDIKPSNILVTMADGRPIPKVIDFGIAKATSARLTEKTLFTEFRQLIGTPEYMSPEQAEMSGIDVDTRTDVYSLGVLLYELLTGTTPFDARELRSKAYGEIQRMIREVEPPRPSTRVSGLGPTLAAVAARRRTEPRKLGQLMRGELDWVVMKAMEKDRTRRYETANGLAQDVRRYLENEPVQARPLSAGYRLRKFASKHKVGAAAAAAGAAALVLGDAGTTAMLIRARAAQRATEQARNDADAQKNRALGLLKDVERAKQAAEKEARRANASSEFLRRMLASPASTGGGGREVKVADVLDRASRELDDLNDQPDLLADARYTLGQTYMVLGLFDEATREFERSWNLARRSGGPRSEPALRAAAEMVWTAMLRPSADGDAAAREPLARETFAAARATLGDLHPVTHQAANALASVLNSRADNAGAEAVLRPLAEAVLREPPERRPAGSSRTLGNLATALRALSRVEESQRLQAEAVAQAEREPGLDPVRRLRIARTMADGYLEAGRLEQAAGAYRKVLDEQRRLLSENHPDVAAATGRYLVALERLGRFADALDLRRKLQASPEEWTPDRAARSRFATGELELWLGHGAAARSEFDAAIRDLAKTGLRNPAGVELWRVYRSMAEAKTGARTDDAWAGAGLRDYTTLVLRSALPARAPAQATGEWLDWRAARSELIPWPAAQDGTPGSTGLAPLEDLRARPDPPPGVYLLSLELPRRDRPPLRLSQWCLWAPWELAVYDAPETVSYKAGDPVPLGATPAETRRAAAFTFYGNSATARGVGPAHRARFSVVGTARLELPPGRYALRVYSDGTTRAWVDGELRLDESSKGGDQREVELAVAPGAGAVALKVECTGVNDLAVALVEPRGDAALALVRRALGPMAEIDAYLDAVEQMVAAPTATAQNWWDYGHLFARRGDFEKAVAPMRKAIDLAPAEHWHWYVCGMLLAHGDDDAAYRDFCRAFVELRGKDRRQEIREYVAAVCAVRPDSGVDPATLAGLLAGADVDGAPWSKLRKGMVEYRTGHFAEAVPLLAEAERELKHRDAELYAQLFRAMAEHRLGHEQEAAGAYALARGAFDAMPQPGEADLDKTGVQEWLAARVVMREAAAGLKDLDVKASDELVAALTRRLKGRVDANLLARRARAYAVGGRFKECAADLARAAEINPEDHFTWFQYACVLAYLGDEAAYRRAVAAGLARFGDTDDAATTERTAKAALLLPPAAADDVARLGALADKAIASGPDRADLLGWYRLSKALVEYRAGRHGPAAELALQAGEAKTGAAGTVAADALRALALRRLGRTQEARTTLQAAGRAARDKLWPGGTLPLTDRGFQDWCVAQVLLREARGTSENDAEKGASGGQ
jgi:serine/threonine protein kinase